MKKYLRELRQNSMLGRKRRFQLACSVFGILIVAVMVIGFFMTSPVTAGVSMAGFGLLTFLDKDSLSEDQKKFMEELDGSLDKAMAESVKKYLEDDMTLKELQKNFQDAIKKLDELDKKDFGDKFDKKELDKWKSELNQTLLALKSATEKGGNGKVHVKSIDEQIREQLDGFITKDARGCEIVDLKKACKESDNGKRKTITLFVTKDAVTTAGSNLIAGVTVDPSVSVPPRYESDIRQYANVARISTRSLTYGEMYDILGDAEWVPEGALKPSMHAKVREVTVNAGKVALTVKLTEETLIDLPQVVAEIRSEIINRIGIAEENGILYGSGTDGEILGVFTDIPAFSLTGLSVEKPNIFDAIVASYTQVVSVSKMNYRPNLVRVNPIDLANMRLTKDSNGQYLFPPFTLANGELIQGLRIAASPAVTQGSFVLGDFNYLNIRDYVLLTIEFGWENDDFTKNLVTMIGEKRLLAYIKANYKTAFVADEFSVVMEAIEAPETATP